MQIPAPARAAFGVRTFAAGLAPASMLARGADPMETTGVVSRPLFLDDAIDLKEQRTARGAARLWAISPTVYVTSVSGHMEEAHADLFEAYGAERIRQAEGRPLFVFHDWLEMTGYESECRKRLTSWSVARRRSYAEVHLATKSKLVAMGVGVANIALGGLIHAYTTRDALERELTTAVERSRQAPRR